MNKLLILIILSFLIFKFSFADNITEQLTQLNNLFKEGAISKEEFSKAKSILLKTESTKEPVNKKKILKKEIKEKKTEDKKKKVKKDISDDLSNSFMHIDEINELGTFKLIVEIPQGMFETKSKHFSPKVKESQEKMYMTFVKRKGLMEKYPENLFKAMGYFEFFYMEQLRIKQKNLRFFQEKWPNIPNHVKKDIKSLFSLNQARLSMRESMGLTLNDDVEVALQRYMLMHEFLSQAKKEKIKLTKNEKYLKKYSKKLNTSFSSIQKISKLRNHKRITDKEFQKDIKKEIKNAKKALKMLTKKGDNINFYKIINNFFNDNIENYSNSDLLSENMVFINGLIKDIEKSIVPKKYIQNMESVSTENMSASDQKILATVSIAMKIQKKHKNDLFHNSMLNLSNNGINVNKYVDEIQREGFDLKSVSMTFDDVDNMKKWVSRDWAKSWKGKLPNEVNDTDGNIIEFSDENIEDLKAQLAINTFSEMISFDKADLEGSINESIAEVVQEIQSSGGFNVSDFLNQDFSISLDNYSRLVGNDWGIEINNFNDLTKAVNEMDGTNMSPEEYAQNWESADHWGDSGLSWGEVTRGVDLIDQIGSFDAASIASELGADLQEVADTISQAAAVGVSTDLEAAAQGLGYNSFADAVSAYNEEHGTNYTVETAKEALGQ